ncbi:Eco57I restriction-modification methylase domain-containing protein [Salmonella enterica]|nr:Eco57I restriction-modification methylase domain-containing protein [Salmonella enterica]
MKANAEIWEVALFFSTQAAPHPPAASSTAPDRRPKSGPTVCSPTRTSPSPANFKSSVDVFPTVDIKGGVAILYRDAKADIGPIGHSSDFPELDAILPKVSAAGGERFGSQVSSQGLYKFTDRLFDEHPQAREAQGKWTAAKMTSRVLECLPELFLEECPDIYIRMLGLCGMRRTVRWIRRDYVRPVESLDHHKVIVPEVNGSGAIGEVLSTLMTGHTDTFDALRPPPWARGASRTLTET